MCLFRFVLALSIFGIFIGAAIFGLHISMTMDSQGNMGKCPFMQDTTSICRMSILEHIRGWQSAFTATVAPAIIALFVAFVLFLGFYFNLEDNDDLTVQPYCKRRNALPAVFNYLQIAFSKGILHSKIF